MADKRQRIDDYKGDKVVWKKHKGVLITLVNRATIETKIRALKNRKAERVSTAFIEMLRAEKPLSIIFDNGNEFAHHEKMAAELNIYENLLC